MHLPLITPINRLIRNQHRNVLATAECPTMRVNLFENEGRHIAMEDDIILAWAASWWIAEAAALPGFLVGHG